MTGPNNAESDRVLSQCWGVAVDVGKDGFVNPSQVTYAPDEESALRKARLFEGVAVTRWVTEWTTVTSPEGTSK